MCVFIKMHVTAQSGPILPRGVKGSIIPCACVCVFVCACVGLGRGVSAITSCHENRKKRREEGRNPSLPIHPEGTAGRRGDRAWMGKNVAAKILIKF